MDTRHGLTPALTVDVVGTRSLQSGSAGAIWGEAVVPELAYKNPRTGKCTVIKQAVRIARQQPFELTVGKPAAVVCWGFMPSGLLRHPLF